MNSAKCAVRPTLASDIASLLPYSLDAVPPSVTLLFQERPRVPVSCALFRSPQHLLWLLHSSRQPPPTARHQRRRPPKIEIAKTQFRSRAGSKPLRKRRRPTA